MLFLLCLFTVSAQRANVNDMFLWDAAGSYWREGDYTFNYVYCETTGFCEIRVINTTITLYVNIPNKSIAFITPNDIAGSQATTEDGYFLWAPGLPCAKNPNYNYDRLIPSFSQARRADKIGNSKIYTGHVYDGGSCQLYKTFTIRTNKNNYIKTYAFEQLVFVPQLNQVAKTFGSATFNTLHKQIPPINKTQPPSACFDNTTPLYCNLFVPTNKNYTMAY